MSTIEFVAAVMFITGLLLWVNIIQRSLNPLLRRIDMRQQMVIADVLMVIGIVILIILR